MLSLVVRRPPQKFHAYLDRRHHFYSRHDNWPIKTGRERSSYLASDNYTVSSRWFDHVSTRPRGCRKGRQPARQAGRVQVTSWRREEDPQSEDGSDTEEGEARGKRRLPTEVRGLAIDYSDYVASDSPFLSASDSSRSLFAPVPPPLVALSKPSLSTSCPLLRKSMRPTRPLLNPVTHDWNIPRFSARSSAVCLPGLVFHVSI